jgi:hypothetical protein
LPTTPGFVHAPNSTLEQSEWTSRPESNNVLFQALNRAWTKRFTASGEYSWYIDKCMKRVGRLCESTGTADRDEAERYLLHRIRELRDIAIYGVRPRREFHEAATKYLNDFALKSTIRRDAAALKDLEPHIGARDRRELAQRSGTRSDGYLIQAANRILSPGPPPRPCCGSPPPSPPVPVAVVWALGGQLRRRACWGAWNYSRKTPSRTSGAFEEGGGRVWWVLTGSNRRHSPCKG